jgi:hypothetical protein
MENIDAKSPLLSKYDGIRRANWIYWRHLEVGDESSVETNIATGKN